MKCYQSDLEIIMNVYPDVSKEDAKEMVINIQAYETTRCLTTF